jgi:regulator of sirC expression with transglutaminase-like and TPR domain
LNTTSNSKELEALIHLLDDKDNEVLSVVTDKLIDIGSPIIPNLEKSWEISGNQKLQERLENIIQEIQFRTVLQEFRNWDLMGGVDLFQGACIVAKFQYPDLNVSKLREKVEAFSDEIWVNIDNDIPALDKIRIINHYFYEEFKFSGNHSNYYASSNYYINQVLETKKGGPVALGIIYITIANMLDLPVYGINLPKNFILAFKDNYTNIQENILFYINPFNKGMILSKKEIDNFLDQQKISKLNQFYIPCSNHEIMERLIYNLMNSYELTANTDKVEKINLLFNIVKKK